MKRVYILFSIVCSFALMAQSCNSRVNLDDEPIVGVGDIALIVTPSIDGGAVDSRTVSLTATKGSFADEDKFSFYLSLSVNYLKLGPNVMRGYDYSNIEYKYTATGTTAAPATAGKKVYYPYRTTKVNLWGIYPYDIAIASQDSKAYKWSVLKNQSTKANLLKSDLLVAKKADVTPTENTAIAMSFAHKMSRIELKLSIPVEIDGKLVSATNPIDFIYFEGMKLDGSYNFIDDATTISATAEALSISPLSMGSELVNADESSEGTAYFYEAVVFPQTVSTGGNLLRVMINFDADPDVTGAEATQGLFTMPLEATTDFSLEMGKQTNIEVTFDTRFRLRLTSAKVLDWTEGSNTDDDVEDELTSVLIGDLYWATGHLVADGANGCKIGAPTDGGLYFQWGKLVGWSGGASGDGTGIASTSPALSAKVKPLGYTGSTGWVSTFTNQGSYTTINVATGWGDPCKHYLGGTWRTPTTAEIITLTGKSGSDWIPWTSGIKGKWSPIGNANGGWFGTGLGSNTGNIDATKQIFFPASGRRLYSSGSFSSVGAYGYCWSSSVYDDNFGYFLALDEPNGVIPQNYLHRSYGFPVRCVSPK